LPEKPQHRPPNQYPHRTAHDTPPPTSMTLPAPMCRGATRLSAPPNAKTEDRISCSLRTGIMACAVDFASRVEKNVYGFLRELWRSGRRKVFVQKCGTPQWVAAVPPARRHTRRGCRLGDGDKRGFSAVLVLGLVTGFCSWCGSLHQNRNHTVPRISIDLSECRVDPVLDVFNMFLSHCICSACCFCLR